MRVLFVCSRNRRRSPTAEALFQEKPGIEVASAGLKKDAETVLGEEDLAWADLIFVMEQKHKQELSRRFMRSLRTTRVIVLNIPDNYTYMDSTLVKILRKKVTPHLK